MSSLHASAEPRPFRYGPFELDLDAGTLECHYEAGDHAFVERIRVPVSPERAATGAVEAAALLVHLVAGVSYFKTAAPDVIDLGDHATTPLERRFLLALYREGLGEFAYRNGLDLSGLQLTGRERAAPARLRSEPMPVGRPLVPFGGGIDSIVTAEVVRSRAADTALFVVQRPNEPFAPIEAAASVSGLPVLRADRLIDSKLLRGAEFGFLQGHVPVTAIISAIAVLSALCTGRDAVVMSNEHSASAPNLVVDGHPVNHQWSKSLEFEQLFRLVLDERLGGRPVYFSLLRPYSELWVGERFAALRRYHPVFRSCNRAFAQTASARLDRWCGECDKCCFIDLVLAPFLGPADLEAIFGGIEPLANPALGERFRTLLGLSESAKPFECVGDVTECRAAMAATALRGDRAGHRLVQSLAAEVGGARPLPPQLLGADGPHHIPEAYAPDSIVV